MTAREVELVEQERTWLAEHAPAFEDTSGRLATFAAEDPREQAEEVARARAWEAHKAEHGRAGISLPVDLGGQGRSTWEAMVFADLESRRRLPLHVFSATRGTVVPSLLRFGAPAQTRRWVPPTLDGQELWCQMFSEPGAGSDLAGLATRARRHGDTWHVTGQKVWTSNGHLARWGWLLARTDPDVPKHAGLSVFVLDMQAPGVDVRPLRQATGGATFCEVFLDDVLVPAECLVGAEHDGWRVATSTLSTERVGITTSVVPLEALESLARERGRLEEHAVRQRIVRIRAQLRVLEHLRRRVMEAARDDRPPGPEASVAKLVLGRASGATAELVHDLLGPDAAHHSRWTEYTLGVPGSRIGGGTEEIMRTIIGERVLGLPREDRPDVGVPWSELARAGRLE